MQVCAALFIEGVLLFLYMKVISLVRYELRE